MRSDILALSAMAFAGFFATAVQADDTEWYAIYYQDKEGGVQLLDSDNSNVITSREASVDSIRDGHDKGMRWKFLSGKGQDGWIATQAHKNHILGYDSGADEFHADFKSSNDDSAIMAHFVEGDCKLTLCYQKYCIGGGGARTGDKFVWSCDKISGA
ncbi:hypothetical protein ACEPAI_4559 [Sanghuangporus weigelae]